LWTNFTPNSLKATIVVNSEIERVAALNLIDADDAQTAALNNADQII